MNKYRIENGKVFEYSKEHNAYLFYCSTLVLTKKQIANMKKELIQ